MFTSACVDGLSLEISGKSTTLNSSSILEIFFCEF